MNSKIIRLSLLVLLALALSPFTVRAASSSPPGQFSYQGFLTDVNGFPLATNAPRNYTIDFKIYTASTLGIAKWGERQTVTVDRGYFTAILGNGTAIPGGTPFVNDLSTLFSGSVNGSDASDRYIGITVQELSPTEIAPRLRLLPTPYSFLATSATKLVDGTGADLVTSSGGVLTVNGPINATSITGSAAGLTGLTASQIPPLDAAKITSGTLPDVRLTNNVALRGSANTFTGNQTVNGNLVVNGGRIGIGTTASPTVPLDVVGDAKVSGTLTVTGNATVSGTTLTVSNKPVIVGEENLRIVRGSVNVSVSSASVAKLRGTGFTVLYNVNGGALESLFHEIT